MQAGATQGANGKWPNVNFPAESVMFKRRDAFKNVVTDDEGNPVWFPRIDPMLDSSGKPVTTSSGKPLYRALVKLPRGTTLRGLDLTGFMISVPINELARERQAKGLPFNVALNPDRELMVFRYVEGRRESLTPDLSGTTDLWELVRAVSRARRAEAGSEVASPARVSPREGDAEGGRGGVEDPGRLVPPRVAPPEVGLDGDGRPSHGPAKAPGESAQAAPGDDDDGFELGYVPEPWELWAGPDQAPGADGRVTSQAQGGFGRSHDEAQGPAAGTESRGREHPQVPTQVEVPPARAQGQTPGQGRPTRRGWKPRRPVMTPPAPGDVPRAPGETVQNAPAREDAGVASRPTQADARGATPVEAAARDGQGAEAGNETPKKRPGGAFGYAPIGAHIGPPKVWDGRDGRGNASGGDAR